MIFKQEIDENGVYVFDDNGEKVSTGIPVADLDNPIVKLNEDNSIKNEKVYDLERKHPAHNLEFGTVEIDEGSHLSGITPIFDSSKYADFNEFETGPLNGINTETGMEYPWGTDHVLPTGDIGPRDWGINTWDTDGGASSSDFDRFFIEWGPNQETSFRFIPLSEGINGTGYVSKGKKTSMTGHLII